MALTVESNVEELVEYLTMRRKVTRDEGQAFVRKAANMHAQFVIRRRFRGYSGSTTGQPLLQRRSGALRNAVRVEDDNTSSEPRASTYVAGPLSYAQIQEFGGTVRPTRRRYLTVPTEAALTKAGVVRASARMTKVGGKWQTAGRVPGFANRSTFIRRVRGTPIIFGTTTNGKPRALWVLKRSVKIPPRFGFMRSWDHIRPAREKALTRMARQLLERER